MSVIDLASRRVSQGMGNVAEPSADVSPQAAEPTSEQCTLLTVIEHAVARCFTASGGGNSTARIEEISSEVWGAIGQLSRWPCLTPGLASSGLTQAAEAAVALVRASSPDSPDDTLLDALSGALLGTGSLSEQKLKYLDYMWLKNQAAARKRKAAKRTGTLAQAKKNRKK